MKMLIRFKFWGQLALGFALAFSMADASSISYKAALINALPRTAEYAAIALANKKILDLQGDPKSDPKKILRYLMLADLCRDADSMYSGVMSLQISDQQGGFKRAYEDAWQYDAFWTMFDLIRFCIHGQPEDEDKSNDENNENKQNVESEQLERAEKEEPAQIANKDQTKSEKLIRTLCIYVLPAIEVGCAALSCSTFDLPNSRGIHSNITVKNSALRAKLKAIQSAARLISEMLLSKKGSKLKWIYAGLLIAVAARLCWDWDMENRAIIELNKTLNAYKTRSPEEWAKISEQWQRNYEECKDSVEAPDRDDLSHSNKTNAEVVRNGIAARKQNIRRDEPLLTSWLHDVAEHAIEIAKFRELHTVSQEGEDLSKLNDSEFLELRLETLQEIKKEVTKLKSWLDESGECKPDHADEIREFRQKVDAQLKNLSNITQVIGAVYNPRIRDLRQFSLQILGASTPEEVDHHYRELIVKYHPDKSVRNAEIAKFLNQVHAFLKRFNHHAYGNSGNSEIKDHRESPIVSTVYID